MMLLLLVLPGVSVNALSGPDNFPGGGVNSPGTDTDNALPAGLGFLGDGE